MDGSCQESGIRLVPRHIDVQKLAQSVCSSGFSVDDVLHGGGVACVAGRNSETCKPTERLPSTSTPPSSINNKKVIARSTPKTRRTFLGQPPSRRTMAPDTIWHWGEANKSLPIGVRFKMQPQGSEDGTWIRFEGSE